MLYVPQEIVHETIIGIFKIFSHCQIASMATACFSPLLINSSNWRWFCIEVLNKGSYRKYTKGNGQLLVAGECLTLGVRGPGEKPSWG